MIVVAVFAVYGLLVEIEALATYRQTGSKHTLIAGMTSGILVMGAVVLLVLRMPIGGSIGLGVILALTAVFAGRYFRTRMLFPSGIMLAVSLMSLAALFRLMS